jgi:hypothetical protein
MKLKFKWVFRYVDEGVMKPDDLNRWAVDGYIFLEQVEELFPDFVDFKSAFEEDGLPIKVCTIMQKGTLNGIVPSTVHKFSVCLPSFEYSTNLSSETYFYSNDLEELKEIAENQIMKLYNVLNSAKRCNL